MFSGVSVIHSINHSFKSTYTVRIRYSVYAVLELLIACYHFRSQSRRSANHATIHIRGEIECKTNK